MSESFKVVGGGTLASATASPEDVPLRPKGSTLK